MKSLRRGIVRKGRKREAKSKQTGGGPAGAAEDGFGCGLNLRYLKPIGVEVSCETDSRKVRLRPVCGLLQLLFGASAKPSGQPQYPPRRPLSLPTQRLVHLRNAGAIRQTPHSKVQ